MDNNVVNKCTIVFDQKFNKKNIKKSNGIVNRKCTNVNTSCENIPKDIKCSDL